MRTNRMVVAGALLSLSGLATGCGGSDGAGAAPATQEGLLSTARAYSEAFIESPGKTYDFLSDACQQSVSRSDWAGQMFLASGMFEAFYGFGLDEMKVADVEIVAFDGETGAVSVTLEGPDGESLGDDDEAMSWRYEEDRWASDDCEIFGSDSSSEVSTETALGWPARFCQLDESMTREEVRAIMGQPTAEFLDSNSQDQYQAYQFSITIFYDAPRAQDPDPMKVRAKSLEPEVTGQFTELTSEDIALFPCADRVFDQETLDAARSNSGG